MSIIDSFDNLTDEILRPSDLASKIDNFPDVVILVFKERFIQYLTEQFDTEVIGFINAGAPVPIYKFEYNGKEFAIARTIIGGAGTAGFLEELIVMGAKKFLIFGDCGTLDKDIIRGHFIIPTSAYRDEGTSYHYVPASDYIDVETADELCSIFDELNVPYVVGKTWTTDALYRETSGNMQKRKSEGCIVVEMECASIMAVSKFRHVPMYQFVYGADTLDGPEWDHRAIDNSSKEQMEREILDIAIKVADKLYG